MNLSLFDQLETGVQKRDRGMRSVLAHTDDSFKDRLVSRVEGFPKGYRFTMDQVIDAMGGRPAEVHQNAIGAITFSMAKRGLIKRTGVMLKAERASLHRTDMPQWERL